jgi:hypothetical protein
MPWGKSIDKTALGEQIVHKSAAEIKSKQDNFVKSSVVVVQAIET